MMTTITISAIAISASVVLSIGILSSVLLIGFLAGQEILQASNGEKHKLLAKSLMIGAIPLLLSFIVIVVMKVLEILA
jgi:hypothetical protein